MLAALEVPCGLLLCPLPSQVGASVRLLIDGQREAQGALVIKAKEVLAAAHLTGQGTGALATEGWTPSCPGATKPWNLSLKLGPGQLSARQKPGPTTCQFPGAAHSQAALAPL